MALNLGPEAYEAITRLKNNPDWRAYVEALRAQRDHFMHVAIEIQVENRLDATGYARGIRDAVAHIELVETPTPGSRGPKSSIRSKEAVNG